MFLINILLELINFHDYHHKFCQIQAVTFALLLYTSEVMILKIEQEDKY